MLFLIFKLKGILVIFAYLEFLGSIRDLQDLNKITMINTRGLNKITTLDLYQDTIKQTNK